MRSVYKCRMCGEVFPGVENTSRKRARTCMVYLHTGVVVVEPTAPAMTTTHECGGSCAGSLGLADFQGWKEDTAMDMGEKTESGLLEDD